MVAILPCQPSEPRRGFLVLRHDFENRPPRLAGSLSQAGLVERSRLLEKSFALRRHRDGAIEMRQRGVEILCRTGDPAGEQMCGRVLWPPRQAGLDMLPSGAKLAGGEQHGGEQMVEHGIAGARRRPCSQSCRA